MYPGHLFVCALSKYFLLVGLTMIMTNNFFGYPVLSDDTSILKTNLGKTYDQWRAKETHVYLATVIEAHPLSRSGENPLNIEVGDGSTWEGYTNGALDADGKYQ